jgi:DDE family transposase
MSCSVEPGAGDGLGKAVPLFERQYLTDSFYLYHSFSVIVAQPSEISKNWRGTPIDYETILKYTMRTKTNTGLRVNAVLVEKLYEKGLKASKMDLEKLNIERHEVNPLWNYTLHPN